MLTPAPDLERLKPAFTPPENWRHAEAAEETDAQRWNWWRELNDPHLAALIERGLQNAPDLRLARARLRQARESRNLAEAGWWPTLDFSTSASRSPGEPNTRTLYRAGFDAGWEPDLFGVVRQGVSAAEFDLAAQGARLEFAQVSLAAEIALNYVDYRLGQERLRIACRNAENQTETAEITRWRADAGLVTELDVEQSRAALAQTRATIPGLRNALTSSLNRLDTLLGQPPGTLAGGVPPPPWSADAAEHCNPADAHLPPEASRKDLIGAMTAALPLPTVPDRITLGIPAETLYRRRDVRAAEAALTAETARLRAVLADRFPSLRLSGSFGWQDSRFSALGGPETIARSLVASIAASLFDGGRVKARIGQQDAAAEQALIAYEQTLLAALEEVENALSSFASGRQQQKERAEAADAARNAERLASQMYQSGLVDFQKVLDAERTLFSTEDALASTRGNVLLAVIQLYKALGGGWTPVDIENDAPTTSSRPSPEPDTP